MSKKNKGNSNGGGGNNDDLNNIDASDCEYCANGLQCPYWTQDKYGNWHHDRSGVVGYDENVIEEDTYGVWNKLPDTPNPDAGNDKKKKRGNDDDDNKPRRFRLW